MRRTRYRGWLRAARHLAAPLAVVIVATASGGIGRAETDASALPLNSLHLPRGFHVDLYARVPGARSLALGEHGTVFVGTQKDGYVYAVTDTNGDHRGDQVLTIAHGLSSPNGVALRGGALYVAEMHRILRFDAIEARLKDPPRPAIVNDGLPTERHHGWKFIAFGPDGWLYVPVGAPCNICENEDPRFASILRMKPDGTGTEVYARGIRNTVGFAWHPRTHALWFTDNGRDRLGDEVPPDELNVAPRPGMHFGYPYCHAGDVTDPEFGAKRPCRDFTPPAQKLGPHVAALGMRFYTGNMFPAAYRNQIFIAEHGSWNRTHKIGYRVTLVRLKGDRVISYEPFVEGWLQGEQAWGRPVDVLLMRDGSLLVSDDHAGALYRITYGSPSR